MVPPLLKASFACKVVAIPSPRALRFLPSSNMPSFLDPASLGANMSAPSHPARQKSERCEPHLPKKSGSHQSLHRQSMLGPPRINRRGRRGGGGGDESQQLKKQPQSGKRCHKQHQARHTRRRSVVLVMFAVVATSFPPPPWLPRQWVYFTRLEGTKTQVGKQKEKEKTKINCQPAGPCPTEEEG